jgi:VanZ family protein
LNNSTTRAIALRPGSAQTAVWWITTAAWAATIYQLSTQTYGSGLTAWLLRQGLEFLNISMSAAAFQSLHYLIRKLAHLSEYAMFALLLYGALGGGKSYAWQARRAAWCIGIAAIYSLTDEFHQLFVPERGASLLDSLLDTAGGALAMLALYLVSRMIQARASRKAAVRERNAEA